MELWPHSLRSLVKTMLASQYPMILTWGPEFIQFYNDAYSKLIGDKHPPALGTDIRITMAESWDTLGPMIQRVMESGQANWTPALLLVIERSGYREEAYFSVSHSPAEDDDGRIVGMLGVCSEVTQQVVGERRLQLLRDLGSRADETRSVETTCRDLAAAIASHPLDIPFALIYLRGPDGKTLVLQGAVGLTENSGVAPAIIDLGNAQNDVVQGDVVQGDVWSVRRAVTGETATVHGIERFVTVQGGPWDETVQQAVVMPIASSEPTAPLGVLVVGVSPNQALTESYITFHQVFASQVSVAIRNAQAYEEERRKAEELAKLDRAKTEFFSNVSHEFRTPLTLMMGPLEEVLERDSALAPDDREQLQIVQRNSRRLLKLVNTLLSFSRIEAGRIEATYEPTDLAGLTADLASVFRSAIERAGVRLEVDCAPLPGPVYIDREMWEKIVLNLLSNAFKFTFEGEIGVALNWQGDHVEMVVRDTGAGIAEAELPHLFERFHRVYGVRSRSHEGTGIGLALVQELVRLHGGEVGVSSELGQGTQFKISIPTGYAHLPAEHVSMDAVATEQTPANFSLVKSSVEEVTAWLPFDSDVAGRAVAINGNGTSHSNGHFAKSDTSRDAANESEGDDGEANESEAAVPVVVSQARILLVDDNADMREYVRRLLADRYEVEAVADGLAALEAARERTPDLVLTDVMMPGLDGFGLLQALRADPKTREISVIMLSARAGEESRYQGLEQGADDYLVKPFRARELLARVEANLRLTMVRREVARQQIANILESITDSFFALDHEWRFSYVNGQCEKRFRRPRESFLGKVIWDEFPLAANTVFEEQYRKAVSEQVTVHFEAGSILTGQWLEVHAYPSPKGLSVYFRDISERKQAEEERERLLQEAQEANRLKDTFLATVSHELRTPLTAIMGWSNLLLTQPMNEGDRLRAHETILRNAQSQAKIIDDILDTSRIMTDNLRLALEPLNPAELVSEAVQTISPAAQSKNIRLQVKSDVSSRHVVGDIGRLQQVLMNLLTNAVKFTPANGSIRVELERAGGNCRISVSDSGQGISAEFLPHVFDRFRQADMTSTRQHGGLGLGLSIVRQLVELHGGSIEASSAGLGKGATFTVNLPLAEQQANQITGGGTTGGGSTGGEPAEGGTAGDGPTEGVPTGKVAGARSGGRLAGVRILVVDDEPDALGLLSILLQRHDAVVQTAGSAAQALAAFGVFKPHVLLSDIGMPEEDGYSLMRKIRTMEAERGDAPIAAIALTAYAREEDKQHALKAGFQRHMTKPIRPPDVVAAVEELIL
jgi:signal transduction histidine kinase